MPMPYPFGQREPNPRPPPSIRPEEWQASRDARPAPSLRERTSHGSEAKMLPRGHAPRFPPPPPGWAEFFSRGMGVPEDTRATTGVPVYGEQPTLSSLQAQITALTRQVDELRQAHALKSSLVLHGTEVVQEYGLLISSTTLRPRR